MSEQLGYSALERPEILQFVFYPRRDFRRGPPGSSDHSVTVAEGVAISCRLYPHSPGSPSILYFHGNGEVVSDYDEIAPIYNRLGINLFVADYRGYGASDGMPTFTATIEDACPVFEGFEGLLRRDGYAGPLFVMGRSLGSIPAVEIVFRYAEKLAGLIIESGFGSVVRLFENIGFPVHMLGPIDPDFPNLGKIRAVTLPMLVIHGEHDELIPLREGRSLYEAAPSAKKRLLVIPGCGHNDLLWSGRQQYFAAIREFAASV
ncbi:MAG TPA: alpha/beta hydrolase [Dehalococcoidia bacterium]|nr:alpha/beta hydrolase [Dehalococcoidia bacterium]